MSRGPHRASEVAADLWLQLWLSWCNAAFSSTKPSSVHILRGIDGEVEQGGGPHVHGNEEAVDSSKGLTPSSSELECYSEHSSLDRIQHL